MRAAAKVLWTVGRVPSLLAQRRKGLGPATSRTEPLQRQDGGSRRRERRGGNRTVWFSVAGYHDASANPSSRDAEKANSTRCSSDDLGACMHKHGATSHRDHPRPLRAEIYCDPILTSTMSRAAVLACTRSARQKKRNLQVHQQREERIASSRCPTKQPMLDEKVARDWRDHVGEAPVDKSPAGAQRKTQRMPQTTSIASASPSTAASQLNTCKVRTPTDF